MKKRNGKVVEKWFWAATGLAVVVFIIGLICFSNSERKKLIERYNLGVEYYNNGQFVEAMDIFCRLNQEYQYYKGRFEISADEYYRMAKTAAMNDVQFEAIEIIRYPTEQEQIEHNQTQIKMLAKTVWGEARGLSKKEQAAVVWCILNRVDSPDFPNEITEVITQNNQFEGYTKSNPINYEIVDLVKDVMDRWVFEKTAIGSVGRVLPNDYMWFAGDGERNYFRNKEGTIWNWTLGNPYEEG